MGMFKQLKDMKAMTEAAPGMIQQARQMGAQAQEFAAAQRAAADAQMASMAASQQAAVAAGGPDFDPIAGVSIETYVEVSKGLAAYGYDQSKAVSIAASKGIAPDNWDAAVAGWNSRIRANPTVGQRFNQLYTAG
jgi:hypothetical protein